MTDHADPSLLRTHRHNSISVSDLLALRALQRKPGGIELDRLNKGLKKKKPKKKKAADTEEDRWKEQMERGGLVQAGSLRPPPAEGAGADDDDDEEEAGAGNRHRNRLANKDNFQGETNLIDVDKHMMAYIEEEMKKRRQGGDGDEDGSGTASAGDVRAVLSNPEDELYKVAEKYTRLQQEARNAAQANKLISNRAKADDEEGEGNVGLSSAMLSGIPEVELGMDSRLRNIEDTEKAKRALFEARKQGRRPNEEDELLANARFSRPKHHMQTDAQALAAARAAASVQDPFKRDNPGAAASSPTLASGNADSMGANKRRKPEMASDEQVMQRFKKRQMNQMKR